MVTSPSNELSAYFDVIYRNELQLNYENHRLRATLYDKDMTFRDGIFYPFFIIRMSDLSGNYPAHVFLRLSSI